MEKKPVKIERRKYPRCNVMLVACTEIADNASRQSYFTKNLGAGGACLVINQPLDKETKVLLEINIQDAEPIISAKGKVVWSQKITPDKEKDQRYEVGIEFTEIKPEERQRIHNYVEDNPKE